MLDIERGHLESKGDTGVLQLSGSREPDRRRRGSVKKRSRRSYRVSGVDGAVFGQREENHFSFRPELVRPGRAGSPRPGVATSVIRVSSAPIATTYHYQRVRLPTTVRVTFHFEEALFLYARASCRYIWCSGRPLRASTPPCEVRPGSEKKSKTGPVSKPSVGSGSGTAPEPKLKAGSKLRMTASSFHTKDERTHSISTQAKPVPHDSEAALNILREGAACLLDFHGVTGAARRVLRLKPVDVLYKPVVFRKDLCHLGCHFPLLEDPIRLFHSRKEVFGDFTRASLGASFLSLFQARYPDHFISIRQRRPIIICCRLVGEDGALGEFVCILVFRNPGIHSNSEKAHSPALRNDLKIVAPSFMSQRAIRLRAGQLLQS
ncbi:hypothetical protein EVAR_20016_1 [Eumeta japonica]|uniref:Uncharacterized protein n=1 Tax=Eumeta variegata TaxID=151549 RepID=A0A4C1VA01_EUMVA|nr:hypothetical protein EVAR_20016_1 [Eumeta japonica]